MDYDEAYRARGDYFGEPVDLLTRLSHLFPPGGSILDIGVGQGRNALPLARDGFDVVGIDASQAAIEVTADLATEEGIEIALWHGSFERYQPERQFDGVLALGLVQEMPLELGRTLVARMRQWCKPGGLAFLIAWQVDDPQIPSLRDSADVEVLGPNSFRLPNGRTRTYLEREQILELLPGWEVVHHWEGLGPEHHHGDGVPERHGNCELVARPVEAQG